MAFLHSLSSYAQSWWKPQSQEIESLPDTPVHTKTGSSIAESQEIFSEQGFITGITNIRDKITAVTTFTHSTIDRSDLRSVKSAINFLKGREELMPEEERAGLAKELENLVGQAAPYFQENTPGATNFEKQQYAYRQMTPGTAEEPTMDAWAVKYDYFSYLVEEEHLIKGSQTEAGAYMEVKETRNDFRTALLRAGESSENIDRFFDGTTGIPPAVLPEFKAYARAMETHGQHVMNWVSMNEKSSLELLTIAEQKSGVASQDAHVWSGRAEILPGRIRLISSVVKTGLNIVAGSYQKKVGDAMNNKHAQIRAIDPRLLGEMREYSADNPVTRFIEDLMFDISSWWNDGAQLVSDYRFLAQESNRVAPKSENEYVDWENNMTRGIRLMGKTEGNTWARSYHDHVMRTGKVLGGESPAAYLYTQKPLTFNEGKVGAFGFIRNQ